MSTSASDQIKLPADLLRDAVTGATRSEACAPVHEPDAPKAERSPKPASAESRSPAAQGLGAKRPTLFTGLTTKSLAWPAAAAGMALAAGLGFGAAHLGGGDDKADLVDQRWQEASGSLKQTHGEVARLAAELKSVRAALDGLKTDRSRGDLTAKQAQLSDKLDRVSADSTAKISKLADQLDRIEKAQRDPARLTPVMERLDRIEKQTLTVADKVTAPTPPPKPVAAAAPTPVAEPMQTGSLGEAKPTPKAPEIDPRKVQIDSHIIRDVDDGVALIEARNGRIFTVRAGQVVAGLGKVEAIERHGRHWVVVTAKGFIGEQVP